MNQQIENGLWAAGGMVLLWISRQVHRWSRAGLREDGKQIGFVTSDDFKTKVLESLAAELADYGEVRVQVKREMPALRTEMAAVHEHLEQLEDQLGRQDQEARALQMTCERIDERIGNVLSGQQRISEGMKELSREHNILSREVSALKGEWDGRERRRITGGD